ncbi:MAG: glycosyl transferase group 1 [Cyanobacteria bacterium RYN_339]|nr:glycosyl transferase group 1 [Cyanobacteria bacterium RYN_339]
MDVLLVSPWRLDGFVCGDDIITDLLMAHPPTGVAFRHFGQALAGGELYRSHPVRAWLASLAMHSRPPAGVRYRWEGLPPLPYRLAGKLLPDRPDLDVQWLGAARKPPFDLIHAYTFPVHLAARARKLPLVLGNSSGNTDLLANYYGYAPAQYGPLVARDRGLIRRLGIDHDLYNAARARLVILPSRYAMRLHAEAGVPEAKLRLVRVGMPVPELPPARAVDGCRFTMVGQGFWRKGGKTLLAAFARLHARHPEARLTIVSNVPELEAPPGVELIPSLPRDEVLGRIYPATDVYVLPTLAEGYGLSVVEAMGHGLPVIASRVGALDELVADGETGRLVAPGSEQELFEAMQALLMDAAARRAMGAAGRAAFLADHAVEVTNRALAAAYAEALG